MHAQAVSLAHGSQLTAPAGADTRNRPDAVRLRRALEADQGAISALVHAERLNPHDLDWRRFWVASHGSQIVAAGQIRQHPDGSREVSSIVVAPSYRGRGLATRLLQMLLATSPGDHYLVTGVPLSRYYAGLGFRRVGVVRAPRCIRRNLWLGQFAGAVFSCLNGRKPRRLIIMHRPGAPSS